MISAVDNHSIGEMRPSRHLEITSAAIEPTMNAPVLRTTANICPTASSPFGFIHQ